MTKSVIVIGPDRVGKTTTVAHLSRMLRIPSFKCPSEKEIFRSDGRQSLVFDHMLTHFLGQTGFSFVSDRGYPCEMAYSQVFGRPTDMTLLRLIDDAHAGLGTRILYLWSSTPPTEPDDLVPAERYWDVARAYERFCAWTSCWVARVDVAGMLQTYRNGGDNSEDVAVMCLDLLGLRHCGIIV